MKMTKLPGLYSPMHLGDIAKIYRDFFNCTGKSKQKAAEKLEHFDYVCSSFPDDSPEAAYMNKYRLIATNLAKSMNEIDGNYDLLKQNLEKEYEQKTDRLMKRTVLGEAFDGIRDIAVGVLGYGGAKIMGRYLDLDLGEDMETHLPYMVGIATAWLSNKIEGMYKSYARRKLTKNSKRDSSELEAERSKAKNKKYSREINKLVHIYGQTSQIDESEKQLLENLYDIKVEFNSD
jgi:hypothetical protein